MIADPRLLVLLFISSLLLNIYFCCIIFFSSQGNRHGAELGWSRHAAAEAEAVAALSCSGHGRAFLDGLVVDGAPKCECNTCYAGPDCSELLLDCSADADGGDPVYLEPYWQHHAASSAVLVSGWHRMSYRATGDNFISLELEKHIRLLHQAVGNAATDGKFIVFGTGSTQLINALLYALSPDHGSNSASISPARVVASVPYYPVYQRQTDLFDSKEYKWDGITSEWVNSSTRNFIEFVTSPNNPDGQLQHSALRGSSVIYDHCYYWPHYSAISAPADEDVMMFSISKASGHASSRFGWVVLKNEEVYRKVLWYMTLSIMGVSRDTQLRILKIIKAIIPEIRSKEDIFEFGHKAMREKWQRLNMLISTSKRFSLQTLAPQYCTYFQKIRDPSPAYGWLKCEMVDDQDCEAVLRKEGIISRGGLTFGADARYTRLSLLKTQDDFELLMQKMEAIISKEKHNSI